MSLHESLAGLRNIGQWFIYRLEWDGEESKYDKFPCPPDGRAEKIKASDPNNWMTYDQACARIATLPRSGELCYTLGFWLTSTTGYFFFDLDGVASGGVLTADAAQRSARFTGALMEWSSSGTGMHVIARTLSPPAAHRTRPKKGIELPYEFYTDGRGIAFGLTGQAVGSADTYHDGAVAELIEQIFTAPTLGEISRPEWRGPSDDDELIRRMLAARESAQAAFGQKASLSVLWRGDAEKDSNHDMALASHLAFWTGCDEERMRRLMWRSGMVRKKWTTHRTYLTLTINKAIAGCSNVYQEAIRNHSALQEAYGTAPAPPPLEPRAGGLEPPPPVTTVVAGASISPEIFARVEELLTMVARAGTLEEVLNDCIPTIAASQLPRVVMSRLVTSVSKKLDLFDSAMPVGQIRAMLIPPAVANTAEAPLWMQKHCFVKAGDFFYNVETGSRSTIKGFQGEYSRQMPFKPNGKREDPVEWAFQRWDIAVVDDLSYRPDQPAYFEWAGKSYANDYVPSSLPVVEEFTAECVAQIEAFKMHLWIICGQRKEVYEAILGWVAHNVQYPGKKIRWSPIIKGVPGDGKSIIFDVIRAALGDRNAKVTSTSTLNNKGGFTDWAQGRAVNWIEEMRITGKDRYTIFNLMKDYVANNLIDINAKGGKNYGAWNVTNHGACSNYTDGLPIDDDDRRWMVLFTPWADIKGCMTAKGMSSLDELNASFKAIGGACQKWPGQWRKWLLSVDTSNFNPDARAPVTEERAYMIASSRDEIEVVIRDMIEEGGVGITKEVFSSSCLHNALKLKELREGQDVPRDLAWNRVLTRIGYMQVPKPVKWKEKTHRIWIRPGNSPDPDRIREFLDKTL